MTPSLPPERIAELRSSATAVIKAFDALEETQTSNGDVGEAQYNIDKAMEVFEGKAVPTTILSLLSALEERTKALRVALGHMTGGMDGDWDDDDPVAVMRAALDDTPAALAGQEERA